MSLLFYVPITVGLLVLVTTVFILHLRARRRYSESVATMSRQLTEAQQAQSKTQRAYESALQREDWLGRAVHASREVVLAYHLTDRQVPGRFFLVSDTACAELGYSRDELLQMSPLDIETFRQPSTQRGQGDVDLVRIENTETLSRNNAFARRNMETLVGRILKEGRVDYTGGYIARAGRLNPVAVHALRIDAHGQPRILCFARDVTGEQDQSSTVRDLQSFVSDLLGNPVVGIAVFDGQKQLRSVNTACLRCFGCPDEQEFRRLDFFNNRFFPETARPRMRKGESFRCEMNVDFDAVVEETLFPTSRRGKGTFEVSITNMGVEADFSPRGYLVHVQDITALHDAEKAIREMEESLRQARKMEAMGVLAGGIAHDFNNVLTPILGYAEMGEDLCPEGTALREYMKEIHVSSLRAKKLVEQILVFSRRGEKTSYPMRITSVVKEVAKQVAASAPPGIGLRCSIRTDQDQILAAPTQIHQVLMNLCSNAIYAMRERGGVLDISLTSFVLGRLHRHEFPSLTTSEYLRGNRDVRHLRLTVRDTGCGMDAATMKRVFEPFFTTKPSGEGTGMGLALVQGIVTTLGGAVHVESTVGEGTAFHVAFPCVEEKPDDVQDTTAPVPDGSGGCVLFVDDEVAIVKLAERMLTSLGYEAVVTSRSPKALEIFRQNPARFDVVITDQVMPQMTGAELIKELQVIRPDIPIVLCTGFDEKFPREQAEAIGVREFVMKPIVRHDLARAIRRAISEPGAPPVADADLPPEGPEAPGNPPPDSTSVPAGST